jgi:hypothetical protein
MDISELKAHVSHKIQTAFPTAHVRISQLSEDPGDLGVSVFNVAKDQVRAAKDLILDLDEELCLKQNWALIPMVRDVETTVRFYPQFAK